MEITHKRLDAIREITHIGAGNASRSLSEITGEHIEVEFPHVGVHKSEQVPRLFGERNNIVTAVSIDMHREIGGVRDKLGRMALFMDKESAKNLSFMMTGQETDQENLTEIEKSAIQEAGNILTGECLEAASNTLSFDIFEGVPRVQTDMLGSIVQNMVLGMADQNDEVVVFETTFSTGESIDAYFVVIFNEEGYTTVLDKVNDNTNIEKL